MAPFPSSPSRAFTLVELLTVIGIIAVLLAAVVPSFSALSRANGVSQTTADLAGLLERARASAVTNNTYVFVGVEEVDASTSSAASPQVTGVNHYGRVAVAVVASKNGTANYDPTSAATVSSSWSSGYNNGANLVALDKVHRYENVHVAQISVPTGGNLYRPAVIDPSDATSNADQLGNSQCVSVTPFSMPLGNGTAAGQYQFKQVIQFNPQGAASVVSNSASSIPVVIEIGLQQSNGNQVPALPANINTGTQSVIQIDGFTGAVRIYRP